MTHVPWSRRDIPPDPSARRAGLRRRRPSTEQALATLKAAGMREASRATRRRPSRITVCTFLVGGHRWSGT